jgi:hypothetical protein
MLESKSSSSSGPAKKQPFTITKTTTEKYSGPDEIIAKIYGDTKKSTGEMPSRQEGGALPAVGEGKVQGPSHEEGGVPAVDTQTGEMVAEIEGEERIFSTEDTSIMEEAAIEIIKATQAGDQEAADDMAKRLGYAVVEMIAAQEQNAEAQEAQGGAAAPAPSPDQMAVEAANQFTSEPEYIETMQ